jgi:HEAT repeat protein
VGDERVIGPIARRRLVALGDPALDRAIERLGTKSGLEGEAVLALLRELPREKVVPRLLASTESEDAAVRKGAARFLGQLNVAEAEPRLVALLDDAEARLFALRALAAIGKGPAGVERFLKARNELEGVAAVGCVAAAGRLDALVAALAPDHPFLVRRAAEQRLAAVGAPAVPALERAAREGATPRQRRAALRALGLSGSDLAVEPVVEALLSPDRWTRFTAFDAADRLAPRVAKDLEVRLRTSREAVGLGEKDPLLKTLLAR